MVRLYNILLWVLFPIIRVYIAYRTKIGKEDRVRLNERFGKYNIARPDGVVYWIHAASVGESLAAMTFINRLRSISSKNCTFLLTTGTVTSARNIEKHISDDVIHQFIPIDYSHYVSRFFEHWKPDYGFIIESELWPNLLTKSTAKALFLVNARLTQKTSQKWRYCKCFIETLLSKFQLIMAQSEQDAMRFKQFTTKDNVVYTGNLKCSSAPLRIDYNLLNLLKNKIRKYVFVAASTHAGEDEIIIDAYSKIRQQIGTDVTLVIVPRHPNRAHEVMNLIKMNGYTSMLRTCVTEENADIDIICVDTLGELGTFYSIADITFVGGSFVNIGGHNIFEPIQLGKPVLFGPHISSFAEMAQMLQTHGIGFQVNNADDIADLFCKFILDEKTRTGILESITSLQKFDPAENVIVEIQKLIST